MKRIFVSRLVSASVIVGVIGALTVAAVALPNPLIDDNPSTAGEVSGPCDEAEHADDPRCAGTDVPAPAAPAPDTSAPDAPVPDAPASGSASADDNPSTPGDISGPCDEAEHFNDPRCAGTAVPAPTLAPTTPAAPADGEVTAGEAGSITYSFDGTTFTVGDVFANDGWTPVVERASGLEIEVKFLKGTVRIDVQVELEHGLVRERVRTRDRADDSETRVENGTVTRTEAGSDDSGSDDSGSDDSGSDDSGSDDSGSDDSGSDDSGSGHGSDDSGSDDSDNSGSGKSGSGSDS